VPVNFTDEAVLSDYAAVTGFNPVTGAGDNGTVVLDALNYRRKVGIVDAQGNRHKIAAYAALEPGNWHNVLTALYLFHNIGIGINFPNTAMAQFNHGKPWTKIMNYRLDGGHYIPIVAKRGSYLDVVTWSRIAAHDQDVLPVLLRRGVRACSARRCSWLAGGRSEGFDLERAAARPSSGHSPLVRIESGTEAKLPPPRDR
jgi:hypothetical protein